MSRRSWTALIGIAACVLLLCAGFTACSAPKAVINSSYDLAGMLASNPRSVPEELKKMGFKTTQPRAIAWENEGLLDYPWGTTSASLNLSGLSAEDLHDGHVPSVAQLALNGSSLADDRQVGISTNNLMDFAEFEKPFYNERTLDEQSDGLVRRLVGRLEDDKAPAKYWSIEVYQHHPTDAMPYEFADYYLTAWTEEAARSSENEWMRDALATEKA